MNLGAAAWTPPHVDPYWRNEFCDPSWAPNASSSCTDSMRVTSAMTSSQSMMGCWTKPWATNLAFCLTIFCLPEHEHRRTPQPPIDCKPRASPSWRGSSPHGWCTSAVGRCCCWLPSPCTGHRLHWWIEGERAVVSHLTRKSGHHISSSTGLWYQLLAMEEVGETHTHTDSELLSCSCIAHMHTHTEGSCIPASLSYLLCLVINPLLNYSYAVYCCRPSCLSIKRARNWPICRQQLLLILVMMMNTGLLIYHYCA